MARGEHILLIVIVGCARQEKTMRSAVVALVIAFFVVVFFVGTLGRARVGRIGVQEMGDHRAGNMATADQTLSPTVGAFHIVHANGPMNVNIRTGTTASLTFHARADVLPLLTSEVKDGVLTIGINDTGKDDIGDITVTVITPNIDGVTLNGSGNVDVQGVKSADFSGLINGSGNLTANGSADAAAFTVEGSGNIEAKDLLATSTTVKIAGSGNANVNAAKKLDATVEGSGDIRYTGKPGEVGQHMSGSGSVEPE